jgi:hypothetical protein
LFQVQQDSNREDYAVSVNIEKTLPIVQTAALCLIAVLLLVLTLSGRPKNGPSDAQELAALYQVHSNFNNDALIGIRRENIENYFKKSDPEYAIEMKRIEENEKATSDRDQAILKLIAIKRKALLSNSAPRVP